MIFLPSRNIWTPERKWGQKKFQRGIICATAIYGDEDVGVVTVSGATITDNDSGSFAAAQIDFRFTGETFRKIHSTSAQINSGTDWIIPNGSADSSYDVRYTNKTGLGVFTTSAAAEDIWIDLGSTRLWELRETGGDNVTLTATFEVRKDGGAVIDSAAYIMRANNLP